MSNAIWYWGKSFIFLLEKHDLVLFISIFYDNKKMDWALWTDTGNKDALALLSIWWAGTWWLKINKTRKWWVRTQLNAIFVSYYKIGSLKWLHPEQILFLSSSVNFTGSQVNSHCFVGTRLQSLKYHSHIDPTP